ncbi:MAG: hypothetical protein A2Z34_02200 [Planctomycetes bacterium RBG_16_59_8]|nr:MAG: hypothetical protein A2Z34_02200 [Planctomycetes bacterium RBG_16_59_8]
MVEPISTERNAFVPFAQQERRVERDRAEEEAAARRDVREPEQRENAPTDRTTEERNIREVANPNRTDTARAAQEQEFRSPPDKDGIPDERGNSIDIFA